jgi:hypothetical protein
LLDAPQNYGVDASGATVFGLLCSAIEQFDQATKIEPTFEPEKPKKQRRRQVRKRQEPPRNLTSPKPPSTLVR